MVIRKIKIFDEVKKRMFSNEKRNNEKKTNEVPHSNIFYLTTLREEISPANCFFQPETPAKNRVPGTAVFNLEPDL